MQELAERDHLRLLPIAPIELQDFADDAVDPLRVVADHAEQSLTLGHHGAVFLEQLRRLVDGGQRVSHLMRDRGGQPSHRRELHLLGLGLRAAEIFEVNERSAVQSGTDAHEADAQQSLRGLDLEGRQGLGVVLLPSSPVIVQSAGKFGQPHAAAHSAKAAEQPRDLRVVPADHAVQVHHEHAVLHVLDDESIDLLQVRDVDAALRREILGRLRIRAQRDGDADGRKKAEADEGGLHGLRAADLALEQPPHVEPQQDQRRDRRVEERGSRPQEPAACRKLWEQQDRQRAGACAARNHHRGDAGDVADEQCRGDCRQRNRHRIALDQPEREEPEREVDGRRHDEHRRRRDGERLEVEQQCDAEQRGTADRAIETDDPEDAARRVARSDRQRRLE